MKKIAVRATYLNLAGNAGLFGLKLAAGLLSGSIALLSEAVNSFNDIVASLAIFICVRISDKEADKGHPFGHSRAEPVAGIIVAVLAGVLGVEVIRESVMRLVRGGEVEAVPVALFTPVVTMAVKGAMALYFKAVGRKAKSPAIAATGTDSMMDVFVALASLVGIAGVGLGYPILDPVAGLVISGWIMYAGYRIGMENIDYLMGSAPPDSLLEEIKAAAHAVPGVRAINTARAHYVGNFIHVEIHIAVDRLLATSDSHAIGEEAERAVESIPSIEKAFVHIDPA